MSKPDITLAFADKTLYEAALTGYYGTIAFSFKNGTIVMVKKEQTFVVPSTPTADEPNRPEALGESSADDQNGVRHNGKRN